MTHPAWELVIAASIERRLARLPAKVSAAVVEFILGPLRDNPHRVGHALQRELAGLWSARRGNYRIVYEIDEEQSTIVVLRIEHRADVFRQR